MSKESDNCLTLPDLGEVDEVTIVEWMKKDGDSFAVGDDLLEVETEKTTFIVDAPHAGQIERIMHEAGEKVSRGDCLAKLST